MTAYKDARIEIDHAMQFVLQSIRIQDENLKQDTTVADVTRWLKCSRPTAKKILKLLLNAEYLISAPKANEGFSYRINPRFSRHESYEQSYRIGLYRIVRMQLWGF